MLPHELYVAIQAVLARLRAKMHVTLRGLARTLQVTSRRVPRGALRVPREASRAAYDPLPQIYPRSVGLEARG